MIPQLIGSILGAVHGFVGSTVGTVNGFLQALLMP
ncbi:hypothetical protein BJ987_003273 [Nocardia goodfellowii]|jgi:hypothetical protein|uniref:Uncharacterized protein n=1 Tax=Nocardia goodfellowii TaxID=882446 RepID=A0ABS4QF88_9NOCA|nr:hypothetical protein [Nocardia goodfellowii]